MYILEGYRVDENGEGENISVEYDRRPNMSLEDSMSYYADEHGLEGMYHYWKHVPRGTLTTSEIGQ